MDQVKKTAVLFFIIFFIGGFVNAQSLDDIKIIRNELFYTDFDFSKCLNYYNRIVNLEKKSPLIEAYQAAAESLLAKYSWNPVSKYNYLKNAQELLNRAITADNDNPEIRFLRLYIQRSIPAYMGMSKDILNDKYAILENLDKMNVHELGQDIAAYIARYMAAPDLTTAPEATRIKKKLGVEN